MQYADYAATRQRADRMERAKEPGRNFCDKHGWKLTTNYTEVQRPDKITFVNGTLYRTHTPTTHIWYRNKRNFNHNVWVEFAGNLIIVKNNIFVKQEKDVSWSKTLFYPNSDKYDSRNVFCDPEDAVRYILSLL